MRSPKGVLPAQAIPAALLFFNVGVEIGQLLFVSAVLGAIAVASDGRGVSGRSGPTPFLGTQ